LHPALLNTGSTSLTKLIVVSARDAADQHTTAAKANSRKRMVVLPDIWRRDLP
jgi:hypothetical protein